MSDPTPEPQAPLDTPWWGRKSLWWSAAAIVAGLPQAFEPVQAMLPQWFMDTLKAAAGVALLIAIQYGRMPGAQARAAIRKNGADQ